MDLKISEGLEWKASNKMAYALFDPIREDVQTQSPRLADLMESGVLYGGTSLADLNIDEFMLLSNGVSEAIKQRFERHTSVTRRDEDGEWLEELLWRLQHIIRLAYILTMDRRYVIDSSETLQTVRERLMQEMVATYCLITNLDLGIKLLSIAADANRLQGLDEKERETWCEAITQVCHEQTRSTGNPKRDIRIKHINESIDQQLRELAAQLPCC